MKRFAQGLLVLVVLALMAAAAGSAGRDDTPVIADGVISDTTGQGLDGQVLVYAPPPGGGAGKLQLVASEQVEGGGFSLATDNTDTLARLEKANGGFANLQFVAVGGGYFASRTMPRGLDVNGEWADRDGGSSLGEVVLGKGAAGSGPLGKRDRKIADASVCSLVRSAVGKPFVRQTVIGELHVVTGMTGSFSYGRTADSDIGTTFSAGNGPFSVSGSSHIGNSTGSSVTITRTGNFGHRLLSQFRFQRWRYRDSCTGTFDKVEPVRWEGSGLKIGADVSSLDHHCTDPNTSSSFPAGSDFDQQSARSSSVSGAATLLGVKVDADSGFSKSVHLHWHFTTDGVLCGDDGLPAEAGRVFAG